MNSKLYRVWILVLYQIAFLCISSGAQTWVPQNSGTTDALRDVCFVDVMHGWAVGHNGSVLRTTDGGSSWFIQHVEGFTSLYGVAFANTSNGWTAGGSQSAGMVHQTTNGGSTWTPAYPFGSVGLRGIGFRDALYGLAVGLGGTMRRTTNGGLNWEYAYSGTLFTLLDVAFDETGGGWVVGANGTILHNGLQSSGTEVGLYGVDFVGSGIGWAVGGGSTILHTINGGNDWIEQDNPAPYGLYEVSFVDADTGWTVGGYGTILHTSNGGNTWVEQNSGTTQELNGVSFVDANNGWAVGSNGIILRYYPPSYIRLISPIGSEEWHILQTDTVQWISGGYEGLVKIELNRNYPGGMWEILADSSANDSMEVFYTTDPLSNHCRIRISAIDDTLSDVSFSDFSIISSQGYLGLATSTQTENPLLSWSAGAFECPNDTTQTFYIKNYGNESIVVFNPALLTNTHFSLDTDCDTLLLAPDEVSACSLTITYNPLEDGTHHDTLLIMSDAVNSQGGYVRIPLTGQQISTPAVPQVTISIEGDDARLTWDPITESVLGCFIDVTYYLIFYSEIQSGPYFYLAYTPDTTYLHLGAPRFTDTMFYQALAFTDPLDGLDEILSPSSGLTREEVLAVLKRF